MSKKTPIYYYMVSKRTILEGIVKNADTNPKGHACARGQIKAIDEFKEDVLKAYFIDADPCEEAELDIKYAENGLKKYNDIDEYSINFWQGYISMMKELVNYWKL